VGGGVAFGEGKSYQMEVVRGFLMFFHSKKGWRGEIEGHRGGYKELKSTLTITKRTLTIFFRLTKNTISQSQSNYPPKSLKHLASPHPHESGENLPGPKRV
jgi:hypothetical protein